MDEVRSGERSNLSLRDEPPPRFVPNCAHECGLGPPPCGPGAVSERDRPTPAPDLYLMRVPSTVMNTVHDPSSACIEETIRLRSASTYSS